MKFVIGTTDGHQYASQDFTEEDIQAEIDAVDGYIGTGDMKGVRISNTADAMKVFASMLEYNNKNDTQTFTMKMRNGISRKFNVQHVVWWEIS